MAVRWLMTGHNYYPEILTDKSVPKTEESCLTVNTREPQHLITNLFAALLLLKLYSRK